jgi:hypothetical protein
VRLHVLCFQTSFKLREQFRVGATVKNSYHPPAAPCDRLLAHPGVADHVKTALRMQRDLLDPLELLQQIWRGQAALAALSTGEPSAGPKRKNLDHFLASLPELWSEGEASPTHQPTLTATPSQYRTAG